MNARKKKLKDGSGNFYVPITHPDAVIDSTGKTLTQKLTEIGTGTGTTTPTNSNLFFPNSNIRLFIETYTGGANQPIHPSVYAFDSAWNGYKYWMAYTPYPDGNNTNENPCIAVSNDLIKWVTPTGLTNPITAKPATAGDYNSDTHLVYNSTTGLLECWYREVLQSATKENIVRKTSADGITWSAAELMFSVTTTTYNRALSPAVIYENNLYKMWLVDNWAIKYFESSDGTTWTDKGFVLQNGSQIRAWHVCVNRTPKGLEMLNQSFPINGNLSKDGFLTHFTSSDGVNWTKSTFEMYPQYGTPFFDNQSLYRSCMVYQNNKYYIYYCGISTANKWTMSLTISKNDDIMTCRGIDNTFKPFMATPTRRPNLPEIGDVWFDPNISKLITYVDRNGSKSWVDGTGAVV